MIRIGLYTVKPKSARDYVGKIYITQLDPCKGYTVHQGKRGDEVTFEHLQRIIVEHYKFDETCIIQLILDAYN